MFCTACPDAPLSRLSIALTTSSWHDDSLTDSASRSQVVGWLADGALKLAVASPPVDGEANKAVIALLAEHFHLPKRDVVLISGDKGRN